MDVTVPEPRGPEILDAGQCWGLLRQTTLGRLVIGHEGEIDIFPINYAVDGGTIVFRTAPGSKLTRMGADPAVTFEADTVDADQRTAWSVVVKGTARQIRSTDELADTTGLPLYPYEESPKGIFLRIEPTAISGRRFAITDEGHWLWAGSARRAAPE